MNTQVRKVYNKLEDKFYEKKNITRNEALMMKEVIGGGKNCNSRKWWSRKH